MKNTVVSLGFTAATATITDAVPVAATAASPPSPATATTTYDVPNHAAASPTLLLQVYHQSNATCIIS